MASYPSKCHSLRNQCVLKESLRRKAERGTERENKLISEGRTHMHIHTTEPSRLELFVLGGGFTKSLYKIRFSLSSFSKI